MKKLIYICLLSIGALFVSCDNDAYLDESDNTDKSEVMSSRDEMLHFRSSEDLNSYIADLLDSEMDLLEEAKTRARSNEHTSLLYLYSLNLAQLDSIEVNRKKVAIVNSYDETLHFILNKKGEINIGNSIYRINGDFVFKYNIGYESDVNHFMREYNNGGIRIERGQTIEYNENLSVLMHENNESVSEDLADTILFDGNIESITDTEIRDGNTLGRTANKSITTYNYFSSGRTRMIARQFNGYWWFYSSMGALTKTQIKKTYWYWWFGWHHVSWWSTQKAYNRLDYEVSYTYYNIFFNVYQTGSANGHKYCYCNSAKKVYNWSVGFPAAPFYFLPSQSSGQTKHWSHWFTETPNVRVRYLYY